MNDNDDVDVELGMKEWTELVVDIASRASAKNVTVLFQNPALGIVVTNVPTNENAADTIAALSNTLVCQTNSD